MNGTKVLGVEKAKACAMDDADGMGKDVFLRESRAGSIRDALGPNASVEFW